MDIDELIDKLLETRNVLRGDVKVSTMDVSTMEIGDLKRVEYDTETDRLILVSE